MDNDVKQTQQDCLARMRKGGMTPRERMDCFSEFEKTIPSGKLVEEFYDIWAPDYNEDMIVAKYENPVDVCELLSKMIPEGERSQYKILDLGAGTGTGGVKLVEAGFTNVDATDGSSGMLELAKKLAVYTNVLPAEMLVFGKKMTTIAPDTYDIIVSSGSFYPFHLQGPHVKCFLDCVKTGGLIVISACPHNDKDIGLKPVIKELADDGFIEVLHEVYVPKWYQDDDGTVWGLKKLKPFSKA